MYLISFGGRCFSTYRLSPSVPGDFLALKYLKNSINLSSVYQSSFQFSILSLLTVLQEYSVGFREENVYLMYATVSSPGSA